MREAHADKLALYSALRHAGFPCARVQRDLRVNDTTGLALEQSFLRHARKGGESGTLPRFSRDDQHARAVHLAGGGYPALQER